jgi:OMF family outer membrane factor
MFSNIPKFKFLLSLTLLTTLSLPLFAQVWTLQQCIDTAQQYNLRLQISRNQVAMSLEKQKEAKANLIPKVKLEGDYKYFIDQPYQLMPQSAFGGPEGVFKEIQFGTPHNINVALQAALPLYNPQIYGAIQATKTATTLNQLQERKTEEEVIYTISNLYYNAQILEHQLAFVDSNMVNTKELLRIMELLREQQMVKKNDVENVKLQEAKLTVQRETVANNLEQVIRLLKFNIGIPDETPFQIEKEIHYEALSAYQNNNPVDIQLLETKKNLLASEIRTLKYSRIPTLSAFGSYAQTGFGYIEKPDKGFLNFYPTTMVGVKLSMPIFNGTVTKHKITQKNLELVNSDLQLNLLTKQTDIQIENARKQRETALKNISNSSLQLKIARSVYKQTVLQQEQGLANITDVLMADGNVKEAQQNYINAVVSYLKADLELKKLTGNINTAK